MSAAVHVRPVVPSDDEAVLRIVLARDTVDVGEPDYTLEYLHADWARPDVSVWIAEIAGEPVGTGLVDAGGAYVGVHPDHEGRGAGTALRLAVEEGERALGLTRHDQKIPTGNRRAQALLQEAGYRRDGYTVWRMSVDLADAPGPPDPNPVRPYRSHEEDHEAIHALVSEAFSEIEGNVPESFDAWRTWVLDLEGADLDLYGVIDGEDGRPAAALIAQPTGEVGFVQQIAVARRARGRGYGRALLTNAFARFRERGIERAALFVVGSNESALRLYESVGMRRTVTYERWTRPLA